MKPTSSASRWSRRSSVNRPSSPCRHRDDCRLCGSRDLALVLKLAPTPPANAFVPQAELTRPQEAFPLDVWFCRKCRHIQLLDIVDPTVLFG
ncbi:MAG: hypothetical protein O3A21_03310, partial [Proteobacteria bacterium]|nr:hypothetical protein [Pseudomonadota bacterium]